MAGIDLAGILSNVSDSFNSAKVAVTSAGQTESSLDIANAKLTEDIGNAKALDTQTQLTAKLTAQNSVQQLAAGIGADVNDTTGHIADIVSRFNQANQDQQDNMSVIQQKKETSFFDDPLGWVSNQFTLPNDIQKYNDAVDRSDAAENQMASLTKMLDERTKQNNLTAATVTQASLDAQVQATKDSADILANDSRIKAAQANADTVAKLSSLSLQQLEANAKVVEVGIQQQQVGIAQAHLKLAQEEFYWKQKEKQLGDSYGQYLSDTIQTGLKAMYPDNPQAWAVGTNSPKLQLMIAGKLPLDPILQQALLFGEQNNRLNPQGAAAPKLLATSPAQYINAVDIGKLQIPDAQKLSAGIIKNTADTFTAGGLPPGATPQQLSDFQTAVQKKDFSKINDIVSSVAQVRLDQYSKSAMSPDNPYSLPSLNQITSQTPALQKTPLYTSVLGPAIAAKADLSNPEIVLGLVTNAIEGGKIQMNQAASDLATMYKNGQQINVASRGLMNQGFNPSYKYNYPITNPSGIGHSVTDMTNPSAVLKTLVEMKTNPEDFTPIF